MNEGVYLGPYIARKDLKIPQGRGQSPALLRMSKGAVFSFDGDEVIDIRKLLRDQAMQPYMGDLESLEDKE